jgi:hypothetical protein
MHDPASFKSPLRGILLNDFSYVVIKRQGSVDLDLPPSTVDEYIPEEVNTHTRPPHPKPT